MMSAHRASVSGVNYLGRSASIILAGELTLLSVFGFSSLGWVCLGSPLARNSHGKEPVGRLDVRVAGQRRAALRQGVIVTASGQCRGSDNYPNLTRAAAMWSQLLSLAQEWLSPIVPSLTSLARRSVARPACAGNCRC